MCVFLLITFATLEVCARLDDRFATGAAILSNYDFDQLFKFDGATMRGIPHARFAKWKLNSIGMRGPEPRLLPNQTRILVYGASEVFGIYEAPGYEMPASLERQIQKVRPNYHFEVFNGGIPGMRVGSGTSFIKELGHRLHPTVVIIYPTPTHYIGVTRPHCGRTFRSPRERDTKAWPASRVFAKFVPEIKSLLPPVLLQSARLMLIKKELHGRPVLLRVPEASIDAFETDLNCAIDAVQAIGAVPILVTHASRFATVNQDGDGYWLTGWRAQYPELDERGFIDLELRANQRIRRVAFARNMILAPADTVVGGKAVNFADHAHFSDQGAAEMAGLLTDAVLQSAREK